MCPFLSICWGVCPFLSSVEKMYEVCHMPQTAKRYDMDYITKTAARRHCTYLYVRIILVCEYYVLFVSLSGATQFAHVLLYDEKCLRTLAVQTPFDRTKCFKSKTTHTPSRSSRPQNQTLERLAISLDTSQIFRDCFLSESVSG